MTKYRFAILISAILLSLSSPTGAISRNALCTSLLLYMSSPSGKALFGKYYISPEESQREAFRLAQRIYSSQGSVEQLKPSDKPIYASSEKGFARRSKDAAVAKRLLGVSDFFGQQARTERRLELTPEDPGYWEVVDGFTLKISDPIEAQNFVAGWLPALSFLETFERMVDYSTSSFWADRVPRWSAAIGGLYFLCKVIMQLAVGWKFETIEQTLIPLAAGGFLAGMNDNWIRSAFSKDGNFDRFILDFVSPKRATGAWWGYHGTNGELPLTVSHPAFSRKALGAGDDSDEEEEDDYRDDWHHKLFPTIQAPPYVDKTVLNRLITHTRMVGYPTGMRLFGRVLGRILPNRPDLLPVEEMDKLKVDTFVEQKAPEDGEPASISSVTIWFRRATENR